MAKHKKKSTNPLQNKRNQAILATTAFSGGIVLPAVSATTASASTMSSWERVAKCESGSDWTNRSGDNGLSSGGIQFQVPSWTDALSKLRSEGIDTSNYPSLPYQATKNQQILAGEALLALQGPSAWAVTVNGGAHCGNAASGALSDGSVFKGGPNPFGSTSLQTIANGGKVYAPKAEPKPAAKAVAKAVPSSGEHKVKEGDTLWGIATSYKVDGGWQALYNLNKGVIGSDPDLLEVGSVLKLTKDAPKKYTVKKDDTLYGISLAHKIKSDGNKTPWDVLYEANKSVVGSDPALISPGMVLTIPGGEAPAPAPKPEPKPTPAPAAWVNPIASSAHDHVTHSYGTPGSYAAGYHTGADFGSGGINGKTVQAVTAGTVVEAGWGGSYGNYVKVRHNDGYYSLYAHLSSLSVSTGNSVKAGTKLGNVGSTGNSTGPHLHFEVRGGSGGYYNNIDPVKYLRGKGVSL